MHARRFRRSLVFTLAVLEAGSLVFAASSAQANATPLEVFPYFVCPAPLSNGWCPTDVNVLGATFSEGRDIVSVGCRLDNRTDCAHGVQGDGVHAAFITATDTLGTSGSAWLYIPIDQTAPTGTVTSPPVFVGAESTYDVAWDVADPLSGPARVSIEAMNPATGGTVEHVCAKDLALGETQGACPYRGVGGVTLFRISAEDRAGNAFQGDWSSPTLRL